MQKSWSSVQLSLCFYLLISEVKC
uniref:Uncharacterized protein n=1 Tax=Rhizophora mucronata TaxID=61149 RepID=A0A2P2JUU6_RHIMU